MFRRLLPVALCLLLISCGSSALHFTLTMDVSDAAKQTELMNASKRVVERRLGSLGTKSTDLTVVSGTGGTASLSFSPQDDTVKDEITKELITPFSLEIMLFTGKDKEKDKGDLFVEEQGWFTKTGINEKTIIWAQASRDEWGKGEVELNFTPEGHTLLNKTFRENVGGQLGLFVRERLMSKLLIETKDLKENIVIAGIPSPDIAAIFADDVNTGVHVTFSLP
ncbi:MAG: hypothetical protein PHE68_00365 [Candidatus Peribacteraceae bacterium]|nr:hypothetical protein [Candidatus Peribacteraceae bacterium]MDD5075078.1 hypothetical protein [Candidatus Peribacteraceae bacterium]